jgi:hypothetical protein
MINDNVYYANISYYNDLAGLKTVSVVLKPPLDADNFERQSRNVISCK